LFSLAAFGASASPAGAQTTPRSEDKLQCAGEAEQAQRLRSAGKLLEAGAKLASCARAACPAAVRADCSLWQRDVVRATPSILVHARDAAGAEAREVVLVVDEKRVVQNVGDQAIDMDPGDHVIEFSRPGIFPVTETVHLEAGQKNRLVTIRFKAVPESVSSVPPEPVGLAITRPSSKGPNVLAWTATGLTLAAVGTFAYFGTTGKSQLDLVNDACATEAGCDQASVDDAWRKLVIADVSLGVALVSACAATYFFIADDKNDETPRKTTVGASLAPNKSGVILNWTGQF
jgi:hypothetical protein